jgi:DNA replication initiation complex subunit (GINS family)
MFIGNMTNKAQNTKAFKEAEKELYEEQVARIKDTIKGVLQRIEDQKAAKKEAEDALRLLKLDLEDLKEGKIEKVEKRHKDSKLADEWNPIDFSGTSTAINTFLTLTDTNGSSGTSGTLNNVSCTSDMVFVADSNLMGNAVAGSYTVETADGTKEYHL